MRRNKTAQMQTTVYLCETELISEKLFRQHLNRIELGGDSVFRWTGQKGSIDSGTERTYYMTGDQFKTWKETHSGYEVFRAEIKERGD